MRIGQATLRPFAAPRPGWWLRLEDSAGRWGVGECAPHPGFGAGAAACAAAWEAWTPDGRWLRGLRDVDRLVEGLPPEVAHAVELAALDLLARRDGISLAARLGERPADTVAAHTLVARPEHTEGALAVKVKLRGDLDACLSLLSAVRARCPTLPLRLDANARFDRDEAAAWLDALRVFAPEWVEQPTPRVEDLPWLRARSPIPLAADESVGPALEACLECADVLVVKPMFVGGPRRALAIAAAARRAGRGLCVTHALGSPVERAGALSVAAALNDGAVHGVGAGWTAVPQGPGLGWTPW